MILNTEYRKLIRLDTEDQIRNFVSTATDRKNILCANHVVSEWVKSHWSEIATECYIDTKARNLAYLLGLEVTPRDNGGDQAFNCLKGIVYETGQEIDRQRERAEGWEYVTTEKLETLVGQFVEILNDGILGTSTHKLRVLKNHEGKFFFMKPRARNRGLYASQNIKFRVIKGEIK